MRRIHRHRRGRVAIVLATVAVGSLPVVVGSPPASAAGETLTNTGLSGRPVPLEFGPTAVGVVAGANTDGFSNVWVREANGTIVDLEEGNAPLFWMGTPADPVLVGTVSERLNSDLNSDGDEDDTLLVTSTNGRPFLPIIDDLVTIDATLPSPQCTTRISATLAVACLSEEDAADDINTDGDVVDLELVLIHGDGSLERTGQIIDNDVSPVLARQTAVLRDGSVSVGPFRVFPNGTISDTGLQVPDGEVVALLGTARVVRVPLSAEVDHVFVRATGPTVPLGQHITAGQIGTAVWTSNGFLDLCRLNEVGGTACLGISSAVPTDTVVGPDAALVIGRPGNSSPAGPSNAYLINEGQQPIDLGVYNGPLAELHHDIDHLVGVRDGSGGSRLLWVRMNSAIEPFPGADVVRAVSLKDGRALVDLREHLTVDYNHDGDINDTITHVFDNGTLISLGVAADDESFGQRMPAVALPEGSGVLFAVNESTTGDSNGDGDATDLIAALFDGNTVVNLGRAVAPGGTLDPFERFAPLGANTALVGVWEPGEGEDLDGSTTIGGIVTFALSYQARAFVPAPPYSPQTPNRLLDTRVDGPQVGYAGARPVAGQTIEVTAPAGTGAIALNVTGLNAAQTGFVTVYPCGETLPTASNLNLTPGLITPNLVISKVGVNGKVCIFTQRSADLIADLAGTFPTGAAYTPRTPTRVLDTRADGPQIGYTGPKPTSGQTIEVIAPTGVPAVVLNVTGLDAEQEGFVTVYPCGAPQPTVSNLNLTPGLITPNLVISKVGTNGKVCIFTQRPANLIADLAGTFPTGSSYNAMQPRRVLDTRADGPQTGYVGVKPTTGQIIEVEAPVGAGAVVMNVTGLDAELDGFVTVYPCGGAIPTASSLNLTPGLITPNLVISKVGTNGKVCIFTQRPANLIADLAGTFPV